MTGAQHSNGAALGRAGAKWITHERVWLAAGGGEAGLPVILADLIRANLEQNPAKWMDFTRLDCSISLKAVDAGVSVTLAFQAGTLAVYRGIEGTPAIRISASSEALLGLASVRIKAGLPFLFDREGRALLRGLLDGKVRIRGALRKPGQFVCFARLMSVNG